MPAGVINTFMLSRNLDESHFANVRFALTRSQTAKYLAHLAHHLAHLAHRLAHQAHQLVHQTGLSRAL